MDLSKEPGKEKKRVTEAYKEWIKTKPKLRAIIKKKLKGKVL